MEAAVEAAAGRPGTEPTSSRSSAPVPGFENGVLVERLESTAA
ncbi:hypothetical protein [Streptomyces sp. NBC_00893]|nr:hypothetical protein [Streptomyces sp. NBC_00893]MCX4851566.1 hypothetical protein [Streptomyces sp. NBC_00893]